MAMSKALRVGGLQQFCRIGNRSLLAALVFIVVLAAFNFVVVRS